MALNWSELGDAAYEELRWELIANVEENGNPKSTPYIDGKGIPTIGVGFNIADENVRNIVLEYLGFKFDEIPSGSGNNVLDPLEEPYVSEIVEILKGPYIYGSDQNYILQQSLNEVMARRADDPEIEWADRTTFQYMFDSEIRDTFDVLIEQYDNGQVSEWMDGIPPSRERNIWGQSKNSSLMYTTQ